jgi:ferredoxin
MKEIKKAQILAFAKSLSVNYNVYLPTRKNNDFVFEKLDPDTELINLKPVLTILPPKKFLIPHNEKIFSVNGEEIDFSNTTGKINVILGINSFDIHAISILDQVMTKPKIDTYYAKRRKNLILIGVGPERINIANSGYDIFLEESNDSYLAIEGTEIGKEIIKQNKMFVSSDKKPKKILSFNDPLFNDLDKIQEKLKASFKSKIWEHIAETCFGCGICAYVCPLCYCNEFEDNFCNNCATRSKKWDACFLPNFFEVAGYNSRENLPERIYNWYYHKFVRFPKEYGHIGCVDCGRCIEYCPAKINFKEVLKELTM